MPHERWKNQGFLSQHASRSQRALSVKSYLGRRHSSFSALDACPEGEELSFSSSMSTGSSSDPSETVVIDIPEGVLPRNRVSVNKIFKRSASKNVDGAASPDTDSVNAIILPTRDGGSKTSESLQEIEFDTDLYDMDNYMLSVFMNDESSVYSKGTASTASSSASSIVSTRSRHRGAYHNGSRRPIPKSTKQTRTRSGWLESMQQSSSSFFSEGLWSAQTGWRVSAEWDGSPNHGWDQPNPLFDPFEPERLEL